MIAHLLSQSHGRPVLLDEASARSLAIASSFTTSVIWAAVLWRLSPPAEEEWPLRKRLSGEGQQLLRKQSLLARTAASIPPVVAWGSLLTLLVPRLLNPLALFCTSFCVLGFWCLLQLITLLASGSSEDLPAAFAARGELVRMWAVVPFCCCCRTPLRVPEKDDLVAVHALVWQFLVVVLVLCLAEECASPSDKAQVALLVIKGASLLNFVYGFSALLRATYSATGHSGLVKFWSLTAVFVCMSSVRYILPLATPEDADPKAALQSSAAVVAMTTVPLSLISALWGFVPAELASDLPDEKERAEESL